MLLYPRLTVMLRLALIEAFAVRHHIFSSLFTNTYCTTIRTYHGLFHFQPKIEGGLIPLTLPIPTSNFLGCQIIVIVPIYYYFLSRPFSSSKTPLPKSRKYLIPCNTQPTFAPATSSGPTAHQGGSTTGHRRAKSSSTAEWRRCIRRRISKNICESLIVVGSSNGNPITTIISIVVILIDVISMEKSTTVHR